MPKDYFEVTADESQQGRSIRNIPIHSARPATKPNLARPPIAPRHLREGRGRKIAWGGAILALVALFAIGGAALLRPTTVLVTARSHTAVFDEKSLYTAYPSGAEAGVLLYSVARKEVEQRKEVPASGSEKVEAFASGSITIFNDADTNPVKLIKNTRFEAPNGRVFRIRTSVTVPGKKGTTPGTATATVYADQAGVEYNIAPVDRFTLPGLKTSAPDMYEKVYARSTAAMTGGFSGNRPIVSEKDTAAAVAELKTSLSEKVKADLQGSLSSSELALMNAIAVTHQMLPAEKGSDGKVTVGVRTTAEVPTLSSAALAHALVSAMFSDAGDGPVQFSDTSTFTLSAVPPAAIGSPVQFTVSGSGTFKWAVDADALAKALAGTQNEDAAFEALADTFPGIEDANAFVRPLWRSTFPSDPSDITVVVEEAR